MLARPPGADHRSARRDDHPQDLPAHRQLLGQGDRSSEAPGRCRILFLTQTYPAVRADSAGPFIRDLARGLVRGGDRVHGAGAAARRACRARLERRGRRGAQPSATRRERSRCSATVAAWTPTSGSAAARRWWRRSTSWRLRGAVRARSSRRGRWDLRPRPLDRAERRWSRRAREPPCRSPSASTAATSSSPRGRGCAPLRAARAGAAPAPHQLLARARAADRGARLRPRALAASSPTASTSSSFRPDPGAAPRLARAAGRPERRAARARRRPDGDEEGVPRPARSPAGAPARGARSALWCSPAAATGSRSGARATEPCRERSIFPAPSCTTSCPISTAPPTCSSCRRVHDPQGERRRTAERHPRGDGERPAGGGIGDLGHSARGRATARPAGWWPRATAPRSAPR